MKTFFLFLIFSVTSVIGFAQSVSISDVQVSSEICFGPRYKNQRLDGYYLFYQTSKDKSGARFVLQILDEQLSLKKQTIVSRPRRFKLLDFEYNGVSFSALLRKGKEEHLLMFNPDGSELQLSAEASVVKAPIRDQIRNYQCENGMISSGLTAVANTGFLKPSFSNKKWFWHGLQFINNNGVLVWDIDADPSIDYLLKGISPIYSDSSRMFLLFGAQNGVFSSNRILKIEVRDLHTGKVLHSIDCEKDKSYSWPEGVVYNKYTREYVIYGTCGYLMPGSCGFFVKVLDRDGFEKSSNEVFWENNAGDTWNLFDKEKHKSDYELAINKLIPLKDGGYKVICEFFSRQLRMPPGKTGTISSTHDLFIVDCDQRLKVNHVEKIEKKSENELQKNAVFAISPSAGFSLLAPRFGWLDYSFSQFDQENNELKVFYRSYNRDSKPRKKDKYIFGMIRQKGNQAAEKRSFEISPSRMRLNVYPGSKGKVAVWEYNRKKDLITISIKAIE